MVLEKPSAVSTIKETDNHCEPRKEPPHISNKSQHELSGNTDVDREHRSNSAASDFNQGDRVMKNQSDIFALNNQTSIASSIFSINGSPSRKLYRKKELPPNNVFPVPDKIGKEVSTSDRSLSKEKIKDHIKSSYNDLKRPSSSIRNPLTGTGLSSNDEYKCKTTKRKGKKCFPLQFLLFSKIS